MTRLTKIILIFLGTVIAAGVLLVWNAFHGNPISKAIAKNTAKNYIAETYPNKDYKIENVIYNFKDGYYYAKVSSPTSIDTHFDLSIHSNTVVDDAFEDQVLSGWNTYERINEQYRASVDEVFESESFQIDYDIGFAELIIIEKEYQDDFQPLDVGIELETLKLDKQYDINELGEKMGHITLYAQDNDVSYERATEILLNVKDIFNEADIPFYAIDFVLQSPDEVHEAIHTRNILYDDIHEEGLEERIKEAHEDLSKYYDAIDQETLEN